jgi:pimeloyl-ACP methyl ester carboxylesterase
LAAALIAAALASAPSTSFAADQPWLTLPAPIALPAATTEGRVSHSGAQIWYATYGVGDPVLLLHGGLGSSDDWGDQVPALVAAGHEVIVIDSRGQGRSTRDARPLGYELMESDVIAVLDRLGVRKTAVVGWSDGAILALIMAMKQPDRVSRIFAFGANMDVGGLRPLGLLSPILPKVNALLAGDYARISPTPNDFAALTKAVQAMQLSQPNYSRSDLAAIRGPEIAIVDGEREEFIHRRHTEYLAHTIPGAKLILLPNVGHFAPLQDPAGFNAAMLGFLDGVAAGEAPR